MLPAGAGVRRAAGRKRLPSALRTDVPADGLANDAAVCDADFELLRGGTLQLVPADVRTASHVRPTGLL